MRHFSPMPKHLPASVLRFLTSNSRAPLTMVARLFQDGSAAQLATRDLVVSIMSFFIWGFAFFSCKTRS